MKRAHILISLITAAVVLTGCKTPAKPLTVIPGRQETPTQANNPGGLLPGGPRVNTGPDTGTTPLPANSVTDDQKSIPGVRPEGQQNREALAQQTIFFDFDKSAIKQNERPKFDKVAEWLKDHPQDKLIIEGNCDERGTPEYNRALGERRALAAMKFLVDNLHVDSARVTTVSYGEDKPSDDGHNEAAWSKNRRDDFVVVSPQ
jgi:peptidoglycan-associated lipoprotein